MKKTVTLVIVVLLLAVGGYYFATKKNSTDMASSLNQGANSNTSYGTSQTPSTTTGSLTLSTKADPNLGTYLVAQNGMTLYKYTKDMPGVSNCSGQCAVSWPPYVVSDSAALGVDPVIKGAVSTIKRDDGTLQVVYNGMPLYFWIKDVKVGDTTGQNVGGVWFVVSP